MNVPCGNQEPAVPPSRSAYPVLAAGDEHDSGGAAPALVPGSPPETVACGGAANSARRSTPAALIGRTAV